MTTHPLREWRRRAGLTQAELAARLGTTSVSVSRYETGERRPSIDVIARLVDLSAGQLTADALIAAARERPTEAA